MVGIGFFAPLPLAMMMPFMAGQSFVMGDAFGKAYQYGKRKISAMSNEEFNKLTPTDLARDLQTDYMTIIPSMKASIVASRGFQSFIIEELATIIREIPKDILKGAAGAETITESLTGQGDIGIAPELSASNIDFIKKDIAASQQNFTDISNAIAGFFKAMTLPVAYGSSSGTTTTTEEFNPPEFGDQSPPEIFDKEVNAAINETKYNERIALAKQKENERIAFLEIPKFKSQSEQVQQYQITRGQLLGAYWLHQSKIDQIVKDRSASAQRNRGGQANPGLTSQLKSAIGAQLRAKKKVMNFITLARNITATKMQANRDWNARIWQRKAL